jgi:glycosyltransferase involved in cell wall biosynthesis
MDIKGNPLVSVIVITYNSSKYVLETLQSVSEQTYKNIELIITDDCSNDNTLELCSIWSEINKPRFTDIKIITSVHNTGIPSNCNRGLFAASGEWVKYIAGDDILHPDGITSFLDFANQDNEIKVVESVSQYFNQSFLTENFIHKQNLGNLIFFSKDATARQQYELLLRRNYLHGPSVIINRGLLNSVGGFDNRYRFIEDHPLWLKITGSGHKIYFLNELTVYYRLHEFSVFGRINKKVIFNDFYRKRRTFDLECIFPNLPWFERIIFDLEYRRKRILDIIGLNRNNFVCKLIYYLSYKLSPYNLFYDQ